MGEVELDLAQEQAGVAGPRLVVQELAVEGAEHVGEDARCQEPNPAGLEDLPPEDLAPQAPPSSQAPA